MLQPKTAQLQEGTIQEGTIQAEKEVASQDFVLTTTTGHQINIPSGTKVLALSFYQYGEPKLLQITYNGQTHQGTIGEDESLEVFRSVTTVADPIDKLARLRELLEADEWYTNFEEEHAVSLLRGLNGSEI